MLKQAQLLAERHDRFVAYIKDGYSVPDIVVREGTDPSTTAKQAARIAKELGIKMPEGSTDITPFGLSMKTGQAYVLRKHLAQHLLRLMDRHHAIEVARMTGISRRGQTRAITNPYRHNWTLAEMERLAAARGLTFLEVLNAPID